MSKWTIHPDLAQGACAFPHTAQRLIARVAFAAHGAKAPADTAETIAARLLEHGRAALAPSPLRAALVQLGARQKEARQRAETCRTKLEASAAARNDGALYRAKDLGAKLVSLEAEAQALEKAAGEAEAQEKAIDAQARSVRRQLEEQAWAAARDSRAVLNEMFIQALAQWKELLLKLAAAAGPVLDELVAVDAEMRAIALGDALISQLGKTLVAEAPGVEEPAAG